MTSPYLLRPALAEDDHAIRTLIREGGINPTGLKWPRFVVATSSDGIAPSNVIACGQIKPHADGSQELASIAVTPSWQGQGLARAIIEHLLASHPEELHLMCRSSLGPFYEKFGFYALTDDEMPTYFRRIKRMTKIVAFVMTGGQHLLVMKRRT